MEDTLTIATAEGVRIYAITTKNLVQEAADRHHTSHLATAALGMKRFVKCFSQFIDAKQDFFKRKAPCGQHGAS